ncbi:hypothetical protein A2U01_0054710, partial [Trifolium medium]|nr:hypothetical protein [Trifolium medium]
GVLESLRDAWRMDFRAMVLNIDSMAVVSAVKADRISSPMGLSLVKSSMHFVGDKLSGGDHTFLHEG